MVKQELFPDGDSSLLRASELVKNLIDKGNTGEDALDQEVYTLVILCQGEPGADKMQPETTCPSSIRHICR